MNEIKVNIETGDGIADCHILRPSGNGPWPAILFYMDGGGLREALFDMGRRLAGEGYYVLLPNLFYRNGPAKPINMEEAFREDSPVREKLMKMIASLTNPVVMADTGAFLEFLDSQAEADSRKIGCHGYCMGGKFALAAAGTWPERVVAAASFHGAGLATDASDSAHLLVEKIRARLYIGVAEIDPYLTPGETEKLQQALDSAGIDYQLEEYPGVRHGFAVPGPAYHEMAAQRHWQRLLRLYENQLNTLRSLNV